MCSNMCGEVVAATEGAHANSTLERFLARVNADVACQLVASRKTPVARLDWTRVRSLMNRCLIRPIRVLS